MVIELDSAFELVSAVNIDGRRIPFVDEEVRTEPFVRVTEAIEVAGVPTEFDVCETKIPFAESFKNE